MIRLSGLGLALVAVAACTPAAPPETHLDAPFERLQSGYDFLTPETQALQDDTFSNPGYLWVDRGAELFNTSDADAPSCASCHTTGLAGVAASYPAIDSDSGQLLNLEGRINTCRERHQHLPALDYESDALRALSAYIANQSHGLPLSVDISGAAATHYANGRDYFFTRRGQLNLSCHQCHDQNAGKRLRGDTISQGHGNGFPAYRLEWQTLGSLQRRIFDCDTGVRAEPLPLGSQTYIDLELYLSARANGLAMESPAIRR
ncbi:sulfur oxidation c-type cytochrome SoxA [Hyphomonas johnsonii]|uniref:SoxAX cytochrome complex subunit A n=1 Tax=Hyphomonas johnsonii MHS-2 TaxID=1280950 RepID=A0A059FUL0_9PROT|nr:sulfur oxidation c-type cytochrome SoxA [Hyphomonas johnsonii]KCZ94118.1 putative sulfur oxidation diheme cytochrome SoxA [Hyphomonas johnsonii MHS-2]